jgi:hypothetical protein
MVRAALTLIVITAVTLGCWWEVRSRLAEHRGPLRDAIIDAAISVAGAAIVGYALIVLLVRPL